MSTSVEDISEILGALKEALDGPLEDAEKAVLEEKSWLETVYKGLTGSDSVSNAQIELTSAYTYGFLSEKLPDLAQTIEID